MKPLIAILGAGRARRFGADKLEAPCAGKPLGGWALDAALRTDRPLAWVAGQTTPGFVAGHCAVLHNLSADRGQWTSVACAADFAERGGHDCLLIMLADMPLVGPCLLTNLLEQGAPAACRHREGRPGVPALFPRRLFGALQQLDAESGARSLLAALPDLRQIDCGSDVLLDVDRPANLAQAARLLKERACFRQSNGHD